MVKFASKNDPVIAPANFNNDGKLDLAVVQEIVTYLVQFDTAADVVGNGRADLLEGGFVLLGKWGWHLPTGLHD